MFGKYDISFLTDDVLETKRMHQEDLEKLCRGEQLSFVPRISNHVMRLPYIGAFDHETWLAEQIDYFRNNVDLLKNKSVFNVYGLSLSRYDLHFASAVMGCPVFGSTKAPVDWKSLSKIGVSMRDFQATNLDENEIFQEMLSLAKFSVEATEGRMPIELPYISEPLVEAVNLFGEEFLIALAQDQYLAEKILDDITSTILEMRGRFVSAVPGFVFWPHGFSFRIMPEKYTLLFGCTTQLISSESYWKHVMEGDRLLLRRHALGGCIHLCGNHLQHIKTWTSMDEVKAFQLNGDACDDLEKYWKALRPDQYIIFHPSRRVTVEDAMDITGGKRLVIYSEENRELAVRD